MQKGQWTAVAPTTGEFETFEAYLDAHRKYVDWKQECGPTLPPTFLSIAVDQSQRIVARDGNRVEFGSYTIPWRLFLEIWHRAANYTSAQDLVRAGWNDEDSLAIDINVWHHVSVLRRLISPLGLTVKSKRGVGYRLEPREKNSGEDLAT